MKIEETITINEPEDVVLQRVTRFMLQEGYRTPGDSNDLSFKRGSVLGSWTSFSPRGWQTEAHVRLSENDGITTIHVALNINTTGQMVTAKERQFWDAELVSIEMAALGENVTADMQANLDRAVLKQNATAAIIIGVVAIVLAFLWGFVANKLFDSRIIARAGSIGIVAIATLILTKYLKVW